MAAIDVLFVNNSISCCASVVINYSESRSINFNPASANPPPTTAVNNCPGPMSGKRAAGIKLSCTKPQAETKIKAAFKVDDKTILITKLVELSFLATSTKTH